MAYTYVCPYHIGEEKGKCSCEMAILRFPDGKTRLDYLHKYCGSVDNWNKCSIAKALNEKYDRDTGGQ